MDRYCIFGPYADDTLVIGCMECDEPLITIALDRGPDVEIGELLRIHEQTHHGRKCE